MLVKKNHRKSSVFWGNSRRPNFRAKLWSVSTEELQKASWLETSQSGMVHARPGTGRLCSGSIKLTTTSLVPSTEHQWHWWHETSAQSPKKTKRPQHAATVCLHCCCHLEEDTEEPAAEPADYRAASSIRLRRVHIHLSTRSYTLLCNSSILNLKLSNFLAPTLQVKKKLNMFFIFCYS